MGEEIKAKVGKKDEKALDNEYVLFVKKGLEIYVNKNMELHVRLV